MPFEEFCQWRNYFEWDPFGDLRADYRMASLLSMLANIHRDPKRRPRPFSPSDFLMDFTGELEKARKELRKRQEVLYLKAFFDRLHAEQDARGSI